MAVQDWYPEAILNKAPSRLWGTFYSGYKFKFVGHTTESDNFYPNANNYFGHNGYPHFTVNRDGKVYQHVPISRASRALKNSAGGVQTNGGGAIQVEHVARSANGPDALTGVQLISARRLCDWIRAQYGIPAIVLPPGVIAGSARSNAPQRMTNAQWISFSGVCAHRHVPENDHWNMGAFPLELLIGNAVSYPQIPVPVPTQKDDDYMIYHMEDTRGTKEFKQYVKSFQFALNRFFSDAGGGPPAAGWMVKDGIAGDQTFTATWEAILRLDDPNFTKESEFDFRRNGIDSPAKLREVGIDPVLVAAIVSAAAVR